MVLYFHDSSLPVKRGKYKSQKCSACGLKRAGHVCKATKQRAKKPRNTPEISLQQQIINLLQTPKLPMAGPSTQHIRGKGDRALVLRTQLGDLNDSLRKLNKIITAQIAELECELEQLEFEERGKYSSKATPASTAEPATTSEAPVTGTSDVPQTQPTTSAFDLMRAASKKQQTASKTKPTDPAPQKTQPESEAQNKSNTHAAKIAQGKLDRRRERQKQS